MDLARRIVHRHDQIERRLALQPHLAAAVLVQHHAHARLPLALAPVTALAPLGPHQIGRVQPTLHTTVAQRVAVALHQMLVEMLHVPALVRLAVERQDRRLHLLRQRLARRLAQPVVPQPVETLRLILVAVAPKLSLRPTQDLRRLGLAQLTLPPALVNIPKLLHSPVLVTRGPAHPIPPMLTSIERITDYRTYRVLQKPDNSCAADTTAFWAGPTVTGMAV